MDLIFQFLQRGKKHIRTALKLSSVTPLALLGGVLFGGIIVVNFCRLALFISKVHSFKNKFKFISSTYFRLFDISFRRKYTISMFMTQILLPKIACNY
jgi:hypothetical protein